CNARTMEIYRRLGIAERIRGAGLPADVPMAAFLCWSLAGPPPAPIPFPPWPRAPKEFRRPTAASGPPRPNRPIPQSPRKPLLKAVAEETPGVSVRFGCELLDFAQDDGGVTAQLRTADGRTGSVRAAYLVGCDGGASGVRRQLGIKLRGEYNILELRQALYR